MAPVVCVYSISTVLLVSQDEDFPPEVQAVSEQLSSTQTSGRDVAVTLILHAFQATLGIELDLQALHTALQVTDRLFWMHDSSLFIPISSLKQTSCSSFRRSGLRSWSSSRRP